MRAIRSLRPMLSDSVFYNSDHIRLRASLVSSGFTQKSLINTTPDHQKFGLNITNQEFGIIVDVDIILNEREAKVWPLISPFS